jgi:flagellar FliL protein
VPLLLLVGGGAGAYFTGMLDSLLGIEAPAEEGAEGENTDGDKQAKKDKGSDAKGDKKAKDGKGDKGGGADSAFLPIPTMLVNLNTDDGTPNYLRLTVQLELEDPADREAVEAVIPRVVDQFQTYLRELRVKDLRGSAGIYRLQMELLWRVNQAAAPVEIKDVLFQEILIN